MPRKIGDVYFNGSVDIDLPGVNTTGNQDTSGKAATATLADAALKLKDSVKIANQDFDGSSPISIASTNLTDTASIVMISGNQTITDTKTFTSTIIGNITGSATTLLNPRKIGDVEFNGSVDIDLPGVNTTGNQDTSGKAATATLADAALKLKDSVKIANQDFDGSSPISIASTNLTDTASIVMISGTQTITGTKTFGDIIATTVTTTSDPVLKKDMTVLPECLETLSQLSAYSYTWKDETLDRRLQWGLNANEVQTINDGNVNTNEDGFKSVNYNAIIALLVGAVNELSHEVQQLKK